MRLVAPALILVAGALAACGDDEPGSRYASCIDLDSLPDLDLPGPLSLPEGTHVTDVVQEEGYITVMAVSDGDVDDVFAPMERELTEAGFEIINRDYEGFEAELFFTKATDVAGVVRIRLGPCPEQVTLSVLYDPLETEGGREAIESVKEQVEERGRTRSARPSPTG